MKKKQVPIELYIEPTKPGHKEGFDTKTSPKGFFSIEARIKENNTWKA